MVMLNFASHALDMTWTTSNFATNFIQGQIWKSIQGVTGEL